MTRGSEPRRRGPQRSLHQVTVGAAPGDAITDHALVIRGWLRALGFHSDIYAYHIDEELVGEIKPLAAYRPGRDERYLVYHHSIGSPAAEQVMELPLELILVYHNVTPPEFFEHVDPVLAQQMRLGREQLARLQACTRLALGVSAYNESELKALGFSPTAVLPLTFDQESYQAPSNPDLVAKYQNQGPLLLFVGRIAPNKKQEDLIKLLYFYRRIDPSARLALVGHGWLPDYTEWLLDFADLMGVKEALIMPGWVSHRDMLTYYRLADVYVSMSEHEGFGKPFIESMYLGVPILAYASSGVPYTLGESGVLFHAKDYEALAEVVDILVKDKDLGEQIRRKQAERLQHFLEPAVRQTFTAVLQQLELK